MYTQSKKELIVIKKKSAEKDKSTWKKAKTAVNVVTVIALVICALFLNVMGGIGLCLNNYENAGIALFISTFFLTLAVIFMGKGRMVMPSVFNIIGSAGYIYAINILAAIPNEMIPKQYTEPLIWRIYPVISVTVLVLAAVIMNYFSPQQEAKREARKKAKYEAELRPLEDDEKIL
ncbi:MAG: hypothetical protein MR038_00490 [Oscillospiraceae bacterium]|nr:hypothetical protein [Oscillospiraceae bacterium]